ncbi:hypothetical protein ACQCT5_07395 [Sutcliffiella halmapala]
MKHAILSIVVCSFFIAGCGADKDLTGQREVENGTRLIGINADGGAYEEHQDSNDFNTNQNPNFLDLTEDRPDYGDDQEKFAEVITLNSNLEPGPVFVTGDNARVTAYSNGSLSDEEKDKLHSKLKRKFIDVVPRYRVHLTIKER